MLYENFGDIKQEIAMRAGYGSVNDAGAQYEAAIERAVNQILRHIHAESEHEFLRRHDIIRGLARVTVLDGEATAASATQGSTTVTFDASATGSFALGGDLLLNSGETLYAITKITDETTVEIHPAYRQTSFTSKAYTFLQCHIVMPDDCDSIVSIQNLDEDYELASMNYGSVVRRIANPYVTEISRPRYYAQDTPLLLTSPGATERVRPYRVLLVPIPVSAINYGLDYYKIPTELSSDDDVPDIPPNHRQTLVEGAWIQCASTWGNRKPESLRMAQAIYSRGILNLQKRRSQVGTMTRIGSYKQYPVVPGDDTISEVDIYSNQYTVLP